MKTKKALLSMSILFVIAISIFICLPATAKAQELVYGDLNNDSTCDSADYSILRQFLTGKIIEPANPNYKITADLNSDGKVNSADYTILRRYLIKIITVIPIKTTNITPTIAPTITPTTTPTIAPTITPTVAVSITPTPTSSTTIVAAADVSYCIEKEILDGMEFNKYIVNVKNTSTSDAPFTNIVLGWKLPNPYNPSYPYAKKIIRPGNWWFCPEYSDNGIFQVYMSLKNNNIGNIKSGETVQFCIYTFLSETVPFNYRIYYMNNGVSGGPLTGSPTKVASIPFVEPIWDEYGNTPENAKSLNMGGTLEGKIDYSGDIDCFELHYPEPVFANQPIENLNLTVLLTSDVDVECDLPLTSETPAESGTTKRYDITYSSNSTNIIPNISVKGATDKTGNYNISFYRSDSLVSDTEATTAE